MNELAWDLHQEMLELRAEIRRLKHQLALQQRRADRWREQATTARPVRHEYSVKVKAGVCCPVMAGTS